MGASRGGVARRRGRGGGGGGGAAVAALALVAAAGGFAATQWALAPRGGVGHDAVQRLIAEHAAEVAAAGAAGQTPAGALAAAALVRGASAGEAGKADVAAAAVEGAQRGANTGGISSAPNEIHVLVTSNGSPYLNFQTRIMYGTYKKVRDLPGSELRYFTRLLHRSDDDILMGEVPTVRVDPLTPKCDQWCEFPVSDRPDAVAKWLATDDAKEGTHVLMIETDYVWMKPISVPAEMAAGGAVSYSFSYISPSAQTHRMDKLWKTEFPDKEVPIKSVPPSGPAPALLRTADLRSITPYWVRFTAAIEADKALKDALGWVREMYAYSLAAAAAGVKHHTKAANAGGMLIAQPPSDTKPYQAAMYHYTWGTQFKNKTGKVVWEFDKRKYTAPEYVTNPRELELPPGDVEGLTQQFPRDGMAVDKDTRDTLADMIGRMNAVLRELPPL